MSYRGDVCRNLSMYLQQEAERLKDAEIKDWVHHLERDAELLRMRADREDEMEQVEQLKQLGPEGLPAVSLRAAA